MPAVACSGRCGRTAILKRPKTGAALCKQCFFWAFETEIHFTIVRARLFKRGQAVAIGASGGKDSTVLAYMMKTLNDRYDYGLKLVLLSIDEGISGYRDDSLETVKRNRDQYGLPLKILSYEDLYGWTMDRIVSAVGRKSNCTFCGVFRRQALDRGAAMLGVDAIVTGHNADDIAETIVMNVLRGDVARLQRCTAITTGSAADESDGDEDASAADAATIPRSKPFKYTYEKEIVMYAYFKKLDYFSTECIYSPNAYRGFARAYIKDLEKIRPSSIIDLIHSGERLRVKPAVEARMPRRGRCQRCGYISSMEVCKACVLLEGLNKGQPRLGVGKSSKVRPALAARSAGGSRTPSSGASGASQSSSAGQRTAPPPKAGPDAEDVGGFDDDGRSAKSGGGGGGPRSCQRCECGGDGDVGTVKEDVEAIAQAVDTVKLEF